MALTESHFEWDTDGTVWCKIYRLKSDVLSPIPLIKDAARVIKKYRENFAHTESGTIFKSLTNQYVNRCLKIIKEACEFQLPLTFHIARHTFATAVALKNGIPIETVQIMMGHTKITTTLIYAEVDEEKILDDMAGIEEKLETKRAIIKERLKQNTNAPATSVA
jgi:integrase